VTGYFGLSYDHKAPYYSYPPTDSRPSININPACADGSQTHNLLITSPTP